MKILHIDWTVLLDFLEPWERLAPTARRFLLDSRPKEVLRKGAVAELPALLSGGFLRALSDGERVLPTDAFHETHKVLRSLARHPLLENPAPRTLREYLGDHFTNEERRPLHDSPYGRHGDHEAFLIETVTSAAHVREFLRTEDRRSWEKERLPGRGWSGEQAWTQSEPMLSGKNAGADVAGLVEALVAAKGPVPIRSLPERLTSLSRARLAHAIEAGLRYLLCFPALDAELVPVLMLWPGVAERLARVPRPPPPRMEPEDSFCLGFRIEDLTQLLVRAAEPMRMKADGRGLFTAVGRELERGLVSLPAWLVHPKVFRENAPEERVSAALRLAQGLRLLDEQGERGRDLGLVTSSAGWRWLDMDPRERLRTVLDLYRPEPEKAGGPRSTKRGANENLFDGLREELDDLQELEGLLDGTDEDADVLVPFDGRRANALSDASLFGVYGSHGLTRAAIGAYAGLEPGRAVSFSDFLGHHSEASNPFLSPEVARSVHHSRGGLALTEEKLEDLWVLGLQQLFHRYLLPVGGVRTGLTREGRLTIELETVGRYLLGLTDDLVLAAAPPGKTPVRVQPDFEIVFVAGSPALEAAISRFAERRGTGVGVLFRITRASILQAAQGGLGAEGVLATLAGASATPVPANVEHEIRAWFASCRRLRIQPVHLVRCPDAATAARVLAAAGAGKLEALSETVLALTDPAHRAAVTRACRKAGLFLTSGPPEPTRSRTRADH